MFTAAVFWEVVGEGCYVILATTLQGCNEKLKEVFPRQEMLLGILLSLKIEDFP